MISDDDLLLYYYRELDDAERAGIGAALAEQPELARRLHAMVARLDAVAATPEVPVPPETLQRWQDSLAHADAKSPPAVARRFSFAPRWQLAAAAVAAVTLAATLWLTNENTLPPPAPEVLVRADDGTAYEHGLKWHLASTERQLASLSSATPDERARLVETIISQNRLYAAAAERAGEPQLARVLRAFTPVLESVAADRGEATESSLSQLNFELRVMQARLSTTL
jgi:hypothetical protein